MVRFQKPPRRRAAGPLGGGSSTRHVIRLCVLLALIVLLMNKAKDVRVYEPFFPSTTTAMMTPTSPQVSAPILNPDEIAALRIAITHVDDGSVFTAADADAYYGLLNAAADDWQTVGHAFGNPGDAPRVSVVPLLQQSEQYRGTIVRIEGRLARVESIRSKRHQDHFRVWIRPSGGADRPIVAAVSSLPPTLAAHAGRDNVLGDVTIALTGVYLKRLAYRSGAGADLAPLVIASPPRSVQTFDSNTDAAPPPSRTATIAVGIVVSMIGIAIGVMVSLSANRSSKRLRKLRQHPQVDVTRLAAAPERIDA